MSELIEQLQETLQELRESEARIVFDQKLPVSVPQYQQIEEEYNLAIEHISLLESLVREQDRLLNATTKIAIRSRT